MGIWTDAVESKARIIHEQLAAAQALAIGQDITVDEIAEPYLELLRKLYESEYSFAHLADTSDLVARFNGPAVMDADPTVTVVASVFTDLRDQIRGIAKSIAGLSSDQRIRWPSDLDPHLSGMAHGSLVVGICVPSPEEQDADGQKLIPGISEQVYSSVKDAVRSLGTIAKFVGESEVDESILEAFPDPAIRDTVLVAASRLAPSGRKGIDTLALYGPESEPSDEGPRVLTPRSRKILNQSLVKPVRESGSGEFEGVVREVDLDARRFEIRQVRGTGAIRCVYGPDQHELVRKILDAQVRVFGSFETLENRTPRLIGVSKIDVVRTPSEQLDFELEQAEED